MATPLLSDEEMQLWHAWKRAGEAVMAGVERDITMTTGLSGADYGVLSRLADLGRGKLRQQELANSMGWDKSRLSHHLTRMAARGLVTRQTAKGDGVTVTQTTDGRKVLARARPVHAESIRRHLLARLTPEQRGALGVICELLKEGRPGTPA